MSLQQVSEFVAFGLRGDSHRVVRVVIKSLVGDGHRSASGQNGWEGEHVFKHPALWIADG